LFGAAGKIGSRIAQKLRNDPDHRVLYVEAGIARLQERGLMPSSQEEAVGEADQIYAAAHSRVDW
jgi:nucleoside-diphosphate-sugar epimerase